MKYEDIMIMAPPAKRIMKMIVSNDCVVESSLTLHGAALSECTESLTQML